MSDRAQRTRSLDLTSETRVIYQGFTGKQGTVNAMQTIAYGTNVVGGVSPGKGGSTHLDLPVFGTVKEAVQNVQPDATAIFVPAFLAAGAIMEAIENEIPLIVSVAEGIPVHDMLRVHEMLKTTTRSRLVGPNCPGVIVPSARCRIGIMPYQQFKAGRIGIVSKSGTLSYEAVGETTRLGLGQSLVVGMGGDMLPGTSLVEGLRLFADRADTEAMVCLGEIGGAAELDAAEFVREYNARLGKDAKPVVAMVAGWTAPEGRVMGHAGALRMAGELTAEEKTKALRDAGCHIASHTGQIGEMLQALLNRRGA
ncbi:succinate-CoA ligase [Protomyces lactucae-debilis]|uniref:Succinate-CoA ligase n=1 Tax=Protomyces lactucae-debilis TaxID=2754530 RepID=A0A1Y2FAT0_PROLT|nr:succinate-CoA ligase [Protomyces lactucae-debilis]ORY79965.1 succinate-CoA ligase [Protomyces lactucae-debilis]